MFKTTNAGTNWTDISSNLPNVPVNDIVVDPDMLSTLYVGTDVGVFASTDGGSTWAPLGTGLPAVVIMSLKLHHATRILRAASYGRSAWDIQLPAPVGPTAILSTPTLAFAPQQVGTTSAAQTVTLTNNSSTALSISSITASSGFAETNDCGTSLAAGANCTLSVTFAPTTFGQLTGTVTLTDTASSGSTQTINLKGKGFSGAVNLSVTSLSFGNQAVGTTSAAQTVTLTNTSSSALTIVSIESSLIDFPTTSDCPFQPSTLAGGASCHISVTFTPSAMGTFSEQITLNDSANDSPQTFAVTGTGVESVVTFSPTSIDFGSIQAGSTKTMSTTLTNTGTSDLLISAISITASVSTTPNPYTESDNCPRSPTAIPVHGSCTVSISFAPASWEGFPYFYVSVQDNAVSSPQSLQLSGAAYSGIVSLSPSSIDFGNVNIGQTVTQNVVLTNTDTLPLYISGIDLAAPKTAPRPRQTVPLVLLKPPRRGKLHDHHQPYSRIPSADFDFPVHQRQRQGFHPVHPSLRHGNRADRIIKPSVSLIWHANRGNSQFRAERQNHQFRQCRLDFQQHRDCRNRPGRFFYCVQ